MRRSFTFIFALASLSLLLSGCVSRVITVELTNKGLGAVRNIEVLFPGGSYGVSSLAAGSVNRNRIKPLSAGTVEVRYLSASGRQETRPGPRVEKNDIGSIIVTFTDTDFAWTADLKRP